MLNSRNQGALYLTDLSEQSVSRRRTHPLLVLFSGLLAFAVLGTGFSFIPTNDSVANGYVALAGKCSDGAQCDEETLNGAFAKTDYGTDQEAFDQIMEDVDKGNYGKEDILYAFKRQFTLGYMNEGDQAYIAGELKWYKKIFKDRSKLNCGQAGRSDGTQWYPGEQDKTLLWHNCDVPNLLTEFVQDIAYLFFEPGFKNAGTDSSYTTTPWFGYPSTMPEDVDQAGVAPVTALEVFGYNLKYVTYQGEWDHVKVMTSARALANFGFLDKLKLGTQALLNGILGGVNSSINGLLDDLKSGNIVRIITSPIRFIGNLFVGGAEATIDTVIDTSDTNVFATMSWYRPEFGATLYNARQLSNDEIVDYIQGQLAAFLSKIEKDRDKADPPADLLAINPDTLAAISPPSPGRCAGSYSGTLAIATPPAVTGSAPNSVFSATTQAACNTYVRTQAQLAHPGITGLTVTLDFQATKTVDQWIAEAGSPQAVIDKYEIYCAISSSSATDATTVGTLLECLKNPEYGYPAAVKRETLNEQSTLDKTWFEESFKAELISEFFRKQAASFASPSARYVCLNADGKDMRTDGPDGPFVKLIIGEQAAQRYNPACGPVRSPIQNGLFGNGYAGAQPPTDTRREAFDPSVWDLIGVDSGVANAGLTVSKFTTQISNTFLRLAFSPILQELGVDTLIANMIVGFRDGLFFPLSVLLIVIGALTVFFQAGMRRDFGAQGKSLLLIVGTFFLGALLMTDPSRTIKWVDQAPTYGESLVVGAIFDLGNPKDDNICNAGTPVSSTVGSNDFFGNNIEFDPAASQRVILCENWRVFAFTPYIYGQWGTSYDSLNIDNFNASGSQGTLVGDGQGKNAPYVPLGFSGNNSEKNWGLYQLDLLTSGTVTKYDELGLKAVNPNLYRIADLQAGPDGDAANAPYDDQYYEMWRGDNPGVRIMTAWMGAGVSVIGAITIMIFAGAKILLSIMSMLLLLFMPVMFLIGLLPGQPRYKLKTYMLEIFSLMVQRVVLVAILALMLRMITTIGKSSDNFFYYAVVTAATCLAFLVFRKEILRLFDSSIAGGGGGFKAENFNEFMPRSLTQYARTRRMMTGHVVTGAVGGFMAGGIQGAKQGSERASSRQRTMGGVRNARKGLGGFSTLTRAARAGAGASEESQKGFTDNLLKPVAEQQARTRMQKEGKSEEDIVRQLDQETQRELEAMRPVTKGEKRNVARLSSAEQKLTDTPERSEREIRRDLKTPTAGGDPVANLDRLVRRSEELKPKLSATTGEVDKYNRAAEEVAKDVGRRVRAQGVTPLAPSSDDPSLSREERVQAQRRERVNTQRYLQDSAQELMKTIYDTTQDRLPPDARPDRGPDS